MISGQDIEDMKPGVPEGQTAKNGIGWCVEIYMFSRGWVQYSKTFRTKEEAQAECDGLQEMWKSCEYRVYEVLK
jgi:hypothetical protein